MKRQNNATITDGKIERLVGPQTHICWTPLTTSKNTPLVVLVRADDLQELENRVRSLEQVLKHTAKEADELWHQVHPESMGR